MSQLTNNAYVARSMNGIISIDDGAGGVMEGGVITANELKIDEIQSTSPPNVVNLYTLSTSDINIGNVSAVLQVKAPIFSNQTIVGSGIYGTNNYLVNIDSTNINVSNLNVSTINVPLVTFTTLNASTVNSETSNSSTSNSSTSNSSTSNSSTSNSTTSNSTTANNGTTNSSTTNTSTSNTDTANNVITNTSTINASTFNIVTTTGTTMNMSTVNASIVNTNEIQSASTANVSLYTTHTGNLIMGNISVNSMQVRGNGTTISAVNDVTLTAGGFIYLNSNGNTQVCNAGYAGKLVLSGGQEIRAYDRSARSKLFTDSLSGGDVEFGNASNILYMKSAISSTRTIETPTLNASTVNALTINASTVNASTFGTINTSTINVSTLNASTTTFGTINNTTINTSTLNASNATILNASMGNFNMTTNTLGISSQSATIDLFPTLSTGTINLATNVTTSGAITIGNGAATGSFSVSEGTININPKTTLNMANQIGTGTVNICNANSYAGTLNLCATANISNTSTNTINIGSSTNTLNISSTTINVQTAMTPKYSYTANGTGDVQKIGYVYTPAYSGGQNTGITSGAITTAFSQYIDLNGVWLVCFHHTINCTATGTITKFQSLGMLLNNAGTQIGQNYAVNDMVGAVPATGTLHLCGSYIANITGATAFAPWEVRTTFQLTFSSGTYTRSTIGNQQCQITRIA